jgi:hypothetical protein
MLIPGLSIPQIEGLNADQLAESLYDNRMNLDAPPIPRPKWELSDAELQSSVCQKIRAYLWNEHFSLLSELALHQSEVDTTTKRGKIGLVRDMLVLTTQQIPENTGATGPNLGY